MDDHFRAEPGHDTDLWIPYGHGLSYKMNIDTSTIHDSHDYNHEYHDGDDLDCA
jgi:hypothetical protein